MRGSAGRNDSLARNKQVSQLLVSGGLITPEQADWLMRDATMTEERIEDAVVYRGIVAEVDLLKYLAAQFKTRFVSTEKLSKAEIDRTTLAMVPRQVADTFNVFPVIFDPQARALSVVTSEPDNTLVLKEIQGTSQAQRIQAFVARPAAVKAAIAKWYAGDAHAFGILLSAAVMTGGSNVIQRNAIAGAKATVPGTFNIDLDKGPIGGRGGSAPPPKLEMTSAQPAYQPPLPGKPPPPPSRPKTSGGPPPTPHAAPAASATAPDVSVGRHPSIVLEMPPGLDMPAPETPRESKGNGAATPPSSPSLAQASALAKSAVAGPTITRAPSSIPPASARATSTASLAATRVVEPEAVLEVVNVLVALLDSGRQELRGHSSLVARLVRRLGERLSLPPQSVANIVLGAQLHDIGKSGPIHLTALNVAEYESFRSAALKALMTPTRLLGAANLPPDALEAIEQMYERYDGSGIPDGLGSKEISLGGRMIAIADTYADLIENPTNTFRRQLTPQEACAALVKNKGTIFDPHLVDLFKSVVLGDDVRAKLLSNRHRALLVDPDAEETTVLELRLIDQGFEVKTVRSVDSAMRVLHENEFQLVVSELEIGRGDGLTLLKQARQQPWGRDLPWVIYTRRVVREDAQKAFEMGVLDFVAKPAQPDVLVAKLKALLDQRSASSSNSPKAVGGVSGSLKEMSLPDLVQILSQGRKTGSLRIKGDGGSGEIHFDTGQLVNALWGSVKGADAFYAMCKLQDGEFTLDPQFKPTERLIQGSAEGLLLEGLRRLDEGI